MPSSGVQTCALRSEEHTSELQSHDNLVCRPRLEKKRTDQQQLRQPVAPGRALRLAPRRGPASPCPQLVGGAGRSGAFPPYFGFFLNDRRPPELKTLSLHGPLPI